MDRRAFLASSSAALGALGLAGCGRPEARPISPQRLVARPTKLKVFSEQPRKTDLWAYNGKIAGPQLHMRRGERIQILFENKIPQPTSVHWHGLRVPFEMDGVGSISQPGVNPGESFLYDFAPPDAGLFWYHPHMNSEEQVTRGMFGLIVVDEEQPPPADREVIWSLYDWGLTDDYQTPEGQAFQLWRGTHDYGPKKKLTTNGRSAPDLTIKRGERIRLRIANTSGIRRYALTFEGHNPWVIAWDGNAVEPYQLGDRPLIIGTGGRVDLMLDGEGEAGRAYAVHDVFDLKYEPIPPWATPEEIAARAPAHVCNIVYRDEEALRDIVDLGPAQSPTPNDIPGPDLSAATPVDVELSNATTTIKEVPDIGPFAALLAEKHGVSADEEVTLWTMNGQVLLEDLETFACVNPKPLFECKLGQSYLLRFKNETNVDHPMHLHGHTFKMISRDGRPAPVDSYRDTFTIFSGETVEVAFVADNLGDWMIHCHRGMHQHSGMLGLFRVT